MSGYNAFIALNSVCIQAAHPGLCYYTEAPESPFIPPVPLDPSLLWQAGSLSFQVSWSSPDLPGLFVQSFLCAGAGFSLGKNPPVAFASTAAASSGVMDVCAGHFPSGCRLFFRLRSVDVFGRCSAFSAIAQAERP